ncbi:unnamed protein product [Soboliphyme baturini]|uniref:SAP domain-containing protein n=1 Tax=Soboliphyme baturini TaxID=241478 RepID=A0A183IKC1_9BILA|nr:unnamed protein product [Soboliphyme baturini]
MLLDVPVFLSQLCAFVCFCLSLYLLFQRVLEEIATAVVAIAAPPMVDGGCVVVVKAPPPLPSGSTPVPAVMAAVRSGELLMHGQQPTGNVDTVVMSTDPFHNEWLRRKQRIASGQLKGFNPDLWLTASAGAPDDGRQQTKGSRVGPVPFHQGNSPPAALLYGCEMWSITKAEWRQLNATETAMEKGMFGTSSRDHILNMVIRHIEDELE